ncbi:MAG TPA: hypothetical protein VG714_02825 [Acidobacteriaceae bacterium]|nr:hypothetical protein [Acidobacteriaceae bacterium]
MKQALDAEFALSGRVKEHDPMEWRDEGDAASFGARLCGWKVGSPDFRHTSEEIDSLRNGFDETVREFLPGLTLIIGGACDEFSACGERS